MSTVLVPLVAHEGTQLPINAAPTRGVPVISEKGTRGSSLMMPLGLVEGRQQDVNVMVGLRWSILGRVQGRVSQ